MKSPAAAVLLALACAAASPAAPAPKGSTTPKGARTPAAAVDPALLTTLEWREVGPYRGGRADAVAGIPQDRSTYYFGSTGGGVWKTTDGGISWASVSDGFFGGSIGSVAVSEWDPNVVYVGTGEVTVRGNVSEGDGVWKSTDAGKSWKHVGLPDSRHVTRIRIHPKNPDLVYAAALGHLFGPNDERGVYRSKDGGTTWQRILFVDRDTGAVDLAMDPSNPRVLYATTWHVRRTPWSLESGGPGSGIWKTTDGGDSWNELTRNPGLPRGTVGICGITVSPTNPENLYAIVEAEDGGVFRSKDGGKNWTRTTTDPGLRQRAWYYSRLNADPKDEETVWAVNVRFLRSKDGGRTFKPIRTPHGDNHDLWIDPNDPRRMIESNDGGANVSTDGGESWTTQRNQPTAQFYRVSADDDFPYRLLGAQQDNSSVRIRSRSLSGDSIGERDWEPTAGGESGFIVAKPGEPDVVFGGSYGDFLERFDHRTESSRFVNPWPDDPMGAGAEASKYRFQWNFPIFFSPSDKRTLFAAANVLFRSRDEGASWEIVSPDLTRADPKTLGSSGGPITKDNTSVEYYATIFAAIESPREAGVLWAGSDDGLVHVSRDAGKTWTNVTPKGFPDRVMVNSLDADPFADGGVYLAGTRYKLDDATPYLWKASAYGASWTRIDGDLPRGEFTRVVRADPMRKGLLYAGTERGVWVSFDDGSHWQSLQGKLPVVPVTDLLVRGSDLVAATQGRSFWILDDVTPLRALAPGDPTKMPRWFAPRITERIDAARDDKPKGRGTNPRPGVLFQYFLPEEPAKDAAVKLEILDEKGGVIRSFARKPKVEGPEDKSEAGKKDEIGEDTKILPVEKGGNRFSWNLHYAAPEKIPGQALWHGGLEGPVALTGKYQARLTVGAWSDTAPFEIVPDPRSKTTAAEQRAQFEFVSGIVAKVDEIHRTVRRIHAERDELEKLEKRCGDVAKFADLKKTSKEIREKLTAIEETVTQPKSKAEEDPLNYPIRLNDKLLGVGETASDGDWPPTAQSIAVRDELAKAIDEALAKAKPVFEKEIPDLDAAARAAALPVLATEEEKK